MRDSGPAVAKCVKTGRKTVVKLGAGQAGLWRGSPSKLVSGQCDQVCDREVSHQPNDHFLGGGHIYTLCTAI